MTFSANPKFVPLPRDRVAMCSRPASKHQNKFCFVSKQACIIAYEVRISCKGPLRAALYVYCYLENPFYVFFKQHPWLFTGWWSQYLARHSTGRCLCKHFTIWRMTQNIVINIIGKVASSYLVNLAIEIPNTIENYINSHVFTCRHWLSAMLI